METRTLNILICSSNEITMRQMARQLNDKGVKVRTTNRLVDRLCFSEQTWDFLLIDLDGLNSFLRSLLSTVSRKFPNLRRIGISTSGVTDTDTLAQGYNLELDAYLTEFPCPEHLIVLFPEIMAQYFCDTETLTALNNATDHLDDKPIDIRPKTPPPYNIEWRYGETPLAL
jgi:response regulator RpfG family c-di-GMP phosphodiesterase